jgi:hypothetical protein
MGLALFSLSLRARTWAMPGQSPSHQTLPPPGAIARKVFYDVNGDEQFEPLENGIGGVQLIRDGGLRTYV